MDCSGGVCHGNVTSSTVATLRASAGALHDALIKELAEELDARHSALLAHHLGFPTNAELLDNLRAWCSNPNATVFVLHSVLSTIGREDLAQKLLNKMQSMPLCVMIIEDNPAASSSPPNKPQDIRFQIVMTFCDAELSTALREVVGGDLSQYQIVEPGPWVSWSTKASELKGLQLTLQRRQNPSWKTEQSPYGCNSCVVGNSKGYTEKSKVVSSVTSNTSVKRPSGLGFIDLEEEDETMVKRPNTLSSNFNIQLNDDILDESAMMEVQKSALAFSPSPTLISNDNNLSAFNTSHLALTPDTDDSMDVHILSNPAVSLSVTSVEDEFTIDENTGLKVPLYKQRQRTSNNNAQISTQISQNSVSRGLDNPMLNNVSNENGFVSRSSTDISNVQGNLNNLNSSSQTKLKGLSENSEGGSCFSEEVIHKDDLFKNSNTVKLVIDCSSKSEKVDEMMEINSSPSISTSALSPDIAGGASGTSNLTTSPRVAPFGGLSPLDYIPHHLVSEICYSSTAENADCSSQSTSTYSQDNDVNSITDNSQADNFDCSGNTKVQGVADWKFREHFALGLGPNQNQLSKIQNTQQPYNPPQTTEQPSHSTFAQQDERLLKMAVPQNYDQQPSKKNTFLVHTPVSSSCFMDDHEPPSYLEVIDDHNDMNAMLGKPIADNNGNCFVQRNAANLYPINPEQVNYTQVRNSPPVGQNNMNFPGLNPSEKVRSTNNFPPSPEKARKQLPTSNKSQLSPPTHCPPPIPTGNQSQRPNNPVAYENSDFYLTTCDPPPDARQFRGTTAMSLPQPQLHHHNHPFYQKQPQQQLQQRTPQAQLNGSVVSDDGTCYNYIDNRKVGSKSLPDNVLNRMAPKPPPRRMSGMSLNEQLARVEGWCPNETDQTIENTMDDYRCRDGYYIVWKSEEKNRFVISVSHRRLLNHFLIEEDREGNSDRTVYFIYKYGGYRSESLLDLINHYIQSGIKQPLVDERLGNKAYACIHIPLKCPLKVEFVSRRKTNAHNGRR